MGRTAWRWRSWRASGFARVAERSWHWWSTTGCEPRRATKPEITVERLTDLGLPARMLTITGLAHGPALAERARAARYEILTRACAEAGTVHLLAGHHAADQVETLAMRVLRGSGAHGLAGMAAVRETAGVRLLRPLLGIAPGSLRRFLTACGVAWVEDPLQPRPPCVTAAPASSSCHRTHDGSVGSARGDRTAARARGGGYRPRTGAPRHYPPGGVRVGDPGRIGVGSLRSLIAAVSGAHYLPAPGQVAGLAAEMNRRPWPACGPCRRGGWGKAC